jgi:cyclophilin family peptidyl-prolyl cis-trans isomerase
MMHRMKKMILSLAALALLATPAIADSRKKRAKPVAPLPVPTAAVPAKPPVYPNPPEIVAAAPASDWVTIAPSDLLVMDLAADAKGKPRRVVIQLMPAPFSQGWVGNIRKLAAAKFWDGTAIVRVQDNYVTQWGDPDGEDPAKAKKLPDGLVNVLEEDYTISSLSVEDITSILMNFNQKGSKAGSAVDGALRAVMSASNNDSGAVLKQPYDSYAIFAGLANGWSLATDTRDVWPVHCYGMVGVGRNLSPDTGTGAELYTVIGHAPRHLDRNIALVGRIIEGMEHMSSLPRGTGALGFYEKPEERTAILSVSLMNEMGNDKTLPTYEYLSTESASFAKYADARTNRRDPFFIKPAGGADICNIPVPVRRRRVP